jgi:hypothetical protein
MFTAKVVWKRPEEMSADELALLLVCCLDEAARNELAFFEAVDAEPRELETARRNVEAGPGVQRLKELGLAELFKPDEWQATDEGVILYWCSLPTSLYALARQ